MEAALNADAVGKLRLTSDPPAALLMPILLKNPPQDFQTAKKLFEYLTNRIADFTSHEFSQLANAKMVPAPPPHTFHVDTKTREKVQTVMYKPTDCYFKSESQLQGTIHSKLFTFVDFGPKANNWLRACGVKNEPTPQEIAVLLIKDPKKFLDYAGGSGG